MKIDTKILKRIDELIKLGEEVLSTKKSPPRNVITDSYVNSELAHQWATSVQNLLVRVFGIDSEHYKNFTKATSKRLSYSPAKQALGILKAAKDDYEHGYLFDMKRLIEAEVFDDFLEQANSLILAGYFQPSAVVIGAVLEDGLRKLCNSHGITLSAKPKLDGMNSDLAKAGVYNKLTQKKITALADIRNSAAHGKWTEFNKDDVEQMLAWVSQFMETHYS